jgi:LEA14-like dessication related protein
MQSINLKDISIWNIILAAITLAIIIPMLFLNNKISTISRQHNEFITMQTANIEKLEAEIKKLENENLELKQTLSLYNEKNFKKLLITISEHDRKIELLNQTINKLY